MKTHNITTFAAVAAACLAGSSAYAGTRTYAPSKPVKETIVESCITGDIGFDVTSNYIRNGIVRENQGFIIQPYTNLHFRVFKDTGLVSSVTVDLGIWESFHSHDNRAANIGGTTKAWYESDFTAGITVNVDKFKVSPYFRIYESPSDSFRNAYVVGTRLSYDDRDLLGEFALHPYVRVELGVIGNAGNGDLTGSGAANQYYEVGITPARSYGDLTLSLPIKAGFGSAHYYTHLPNDNRPFGFFSAGIDAAYALNFIPECLGKWSAHSGFTYERVGGGIHPAVAPGFVNHNQFVFDGGLKVAF